MFSQVPCPVCNTTGVFVNGAYLRALRLSRKISLTEMAKKLKLSTGHLCHIEYNRRNASLKMMNAYRDF